MGDIAIRFGMPRRRIKVSHFSWLFFDFSRWRPSAILDL